MRKVRVQEPTPSEMYHCPDGIWLRGVVRGDVRVHVIVRPQATGAHALAEILHSKPDVHATCRCEPMHASPSHS